jgi:hypothetical protein
MTSLQQKPARMVMTLQRKNHSLNRMFVLRTRQSVDKIAVSDASTPTQTMKATRTLMMSPTPMKTIFPLCISTRENALTTNDVDNQVSTETTTPE